MSRASEEEPEVASTTPTRARTRSVAPAARTAMSARRDTVLRGGLRLGFGLGPHRLRARRRSGAGPLGLEFDLALAILAARGDPDRGARPERRRDQQNSHLSEHCALGYPNSDLWGLI